MSESIQSRFLTVADAALSAKVSEETIEKYKDLGLLRAFRVNGQEQYREDEIRLVFNSRVKAVINSPHEQLVSSQESLLTKTSAVASNLTSESKEEPPTLQEILSENQENRDTQNSDQSSNQSADTVQAEFVKTRQNPSDFRNFDIPSIELLELTRSLKDQLETVKEERNWLRRRIEKLEASIEREQMITISKTETLRNLVEQNQSQKKPWAFLLPWSK